jgi:thiamine biosynthesis lipoprotein
MGTTYSIRVNPPLTPEAFQRVRRAVETELKSVNRQMSTWQPDSEISRFNRIEAGQALSISNPFAETVKEAIRLCRLSNGAFDPTLEPLINLWGFGPQKTAALEEPSADEIAAARARTGIDGIELQPGPKLLKKNPGLSLSLSAIAKGYGVDAVANLLRLEKLDGFLVEIGGEIYAEGEKTPGIPWKIGIELPKPQQYGRLSGKLSLRNRAVATSGDYHNRRQERTGTFYTHILDPRIGRPVQTPVASVTVLADRCMTADGLATALFVTGPEEGLELIEKLPGTEALFILRDAGGTYLFRTSSGFTKLTSFEKVASQAD